MDLLNKLLQAILEVALPILVSAAAVWLVGKAREVFRKLKEVNPEAYQILAAVARRAVLAAEQVYVGEGRGKEKKEYALKVINAYLKSKKINLDLEIIYAYIEAEVKRMNDEEHIFYLSENSGQVEITEE